MSETMAALLQLQNMDSKLANGEVEATAYRLRKRKEVVRAIPANAARDYDRLRSRHSNAIVPVVDNTCMGCFVQLPSAVSSRLGNGRDVVCCDHCGRILYIPDQE